MTCYYGQSNSYLNYDEAQCGTWLNNKLTTIDERIKAGGAVARIMQAIKKEYTKCKVNWLSAPVTGSPNAPYQNGGSVTTTTELDLGLFGRDTDGYNLDLGLFGRDTDG